MNFFRKLTLFICALSTFTGSQSDFAHAEPGPMPNALMSTPSPEGVPLRENFSRGQLITIGALYPLSIILVTNGGKFFDQPQPSIGSPDPGSLDYRISKGLHGNLETGEKLLGGVPDRAAYAVGGLPAAYYAFSSLYHLSTGQNLFASQSPYIYHSTIAFAEAYGWTAFVTTAVKFLVGRPRPYLGLDRPGYAWKPEEDNLSFFSGHASLAFAATSFLYRDISNGLYYRHLDQWAPVPRYLAAKALPFTLLYGTASMIAFSRIYDQQHYFSDVITGALIGGLIGNLVYLNRFDHEGKPRSRYRSSIEATSLASEAPKTSWSMSPLMTTLNKVPVIGGQLRYIW
jgi:membrane-associated phospholipid phosphatase